jgi:hypothetical protein
VESSILRLYPQFDESKDRRQEGFAVGFERRSGDDRRQGQRLSDPKLGQDITSVQDTFKAFIRKDDQNPAKKNSEKTKKIFAALSLIIPVRRLSSLSDNIEDHNYVRAAGLVALAGIMLPEDTRDLKDGLKQLLTNILPRKLRAGIAKNNRNLYKDFVWFNPKYDYKNYQAPFSFFRGTVLEPLTNKMHKLGNKLYKLDKSLFDTKKFHKVLELLKVEIEDSIPTGRVDVNNTPIYAYKLKGNPFAKLLGKALLRTTVFGLATLAVLELPAIFNAFLGKENQENNLNNGIKQILKSSIYVTSVLSGIGITGAAIAKKGPAGSLFGMGLGALLGSYLSKLFCSFIDAKEPSSKHLLNF